MGTYYVFKPNFEITAEVSAPDSRHARTAFLDYLSRSGQILYSQRQETRRELITKKMQPGEIQTSVQLEYGIKESPVQEIEIPKEPTREEVLQRLDETDLSESTKALPEEDFMREPPQQQAQPQQSSPFGNSPIMDLSRKSGGM